MATLPNIWEMRVADIRQELESNGIPTKTFLEKRDLVEALKQVRNGEKTPAPSPAATASSPGGSVNTNSSRHEKIRKEVMKAYELKASDLKKKLEDMGISTASFFEKSEFVKAYAEAVVDGGTASAKTTGSAGSRVKEEPQSARHGVKAEPRSPRRTAKEDPQSGRREVKEDPPPSKGGDKEGPQPRSKAYRYAEPDGVSARTKGTGPVGSVPKQEPQPSGSGVWEEPQSDRGGVKDDPQPGRSVWEEPPSTSRGAREDPQPTTSSAQEEPFDPSYRDVVMQKYDPTKIMQ
jgi:hypothetical protein